jgi:hypothetical protein
MANANSNNNNQPGFEQKTEGYRKIEYDIPVFGLRLNEADEIKLEEYNSATASPARKLEIEKELKPKVDDYERRVNHELMNSPKEECFKGEFESIKENNKSLKKQLEAEQKTDISPVYLEEVRILLGRVFYARPQLKKFFENYCELKLNNTDPQNPGKTTVKCAESDAVNKMIKYEIEIDNDAFLDHVPVTQPDGSKKDMHYVNNYKFCYVVTRAIASIMPNTYKLAGFWKNEIAKENCKRIDPLLIDASSNIDNDWQAFFALCITAPNVAKNTNAKAFDFFENYINQESYGDPVYIKKDEIVDSREAKKVVLADEYVFGEKTDKKSSWSNFIDGVRADGLINHGLMWATGSFSNWITSGRERVEYKLVFRKGNDWANKALVEIDAKEVQKILAREEGMGGRDLQLAELITFHDKDACRRLILADSYTSDFQEWRLELYAMTFDPLYISSKGQKISEETFSFFERCRRESDKRGKRTGTKVMHFERGKKTGEFIRRTNKEIEKDCLKEWTDLSDRTAQGAPQETFQYMYIGDRLLNPDEEYGLTGSDDDWEMTTGNLKTILGNADVAKHFLTSMQEFAKTNPDRFWNKKLGPDQIAAIQRMYAIEKNLPGGKFAMHEHQRVLANKAYFAYKENQWIKPPKTGEEEKDKILIDELYKDEENAHEKVENANIKDLVKIYNNTNKDNKENTYTRTKEQLDAIKNRIKKDDNIDEHLTSFVLQLFSEIEDQFENDSKRLNLWDADTIEIVLFKKKNELEKLFKEKPDQFTDKQKELIFNQFERFEHILTSLDVLEHYGKIFAPYKESAEQKKTNILFSKSNDALINETKKMHKVKVEKADKKIAENLYDEIKKIIESDKNFLNDPVFYTDKYFEYTGIASINRNSDPSNIMEILLNLAVINDDLQDFEKFHNLKVDELYKKVKEDYCRGNTVNFDDYLKDYNNLILLTPGNNEPQNIGEIFMRLAIKKRCFAEFQEAEINYADNLNEKINRDWLKDDFDEQYFQGYLDSYKELQLLPQDAENEPKNILDLQSHLRIGIAVISCMVNQNKKNESKDSKPSKPASSSE